MPETKMTSPTLPASLELDGADRLAGELCVLSDGNLQLAATRPVDAAHNSTDAGRRPGETAILNLGSLRDSEGFIDNVAVRITGVAGDTIQLEFCNRDGRLEQRCRNLLPGHRAERESSGKNSDLPTLAENHFEKLRRISITQLDSLLHEFLIELCNHLLDLSAKSKQATSGESTHYEAMNVVKKKGLGIVESVCEKIGAYYDNLIPDKDSEARNELADQDTEDLNLVDLKEFEGNLAIRRMISTGERLYEIDLECLVIRLAELVERDPHSLRLPVHIAQICVAFRRALDGQGIPEQTLPDIFDFFGRNFIQDLGEYYSSLNSFLRENDIRPGLEEEIRKKGSLLNRPGPIKKSRETKPRGVTEPIAEFAAASQADPEAAAVARAAQGTYRDKFSPDNLYKSVIDALNFKREADQIQSTATAGTFANRPGTPASAGGASGGEPARTEYGKLADADSIAHILGQMQHDSSQRSAVQQSASLREYLASNQDQISGLEETDGLSPESLNQLDLVDNMFGSIKSQMDVNADLKPVLGNLQIPLARLALLEPQFFVDRSHSARGVMDKLAQLTASANFPNKVLEGRIEGIVDHIVTDYNNDSAVFDIALTEVDKLLAKQERAITRNVDRVVRTQEGNEKLKRAQLVVSRILRQRIAPPMAPAVLVDLVDCGWRDLLILTHIKEGPDSQAWKGHILTLDLLAKWLGERHEGNLDEDVLMQRSTESEPLIDLIDQQISAALPTSVEHEPVLKNLRDILSGKEPIVMCDVAETEDDALPPREVRAKIENLPRLRRWIRRVEELQKGTWLTYRDQLGQKRRMQLAWVSDAKDRYIFVNERGQKNADLTSIQLARQLGRGVHPPPPVDKLSLVDRSMFETLEDVQKSLSFAKNHDSLTNLINRGTFIDQLNRALRHAQRKHSQHAILCLNIDQFSLVNDIYDRVTGDQVLTEFARLLSQLHGRKSSSARLQDDEFAVLLLDRNTDQAQLFAEKIRSDIETSSVEIDGEKVAFTVSIGVAPVVDYCAAVDDILESAHGAMLQAKKNGRNSVVVFEENRLKAESYQNEQAQAEADIKHTIETDRFRLRAQPIVQTEIGSEAVASHHFELLLGIVEPDGSLGSPIDFIANAERYGYMTLVDRWVVREAFEWISELVDKQKVVPKISINLSGHSVTDDAFMEYLLEQISEYGVGTNLLCFEITETGTISNLVKAADFVRTFRNIGCKFSIDDFGTGMASHNYLRELPVDYVKIDGTFITGINQNRNDYAMARSINDLAHFLGQETVAESVENEAIIESLQEIGVDYLQGWGVGMPRLLEEVTESLSNIEK